VSSTNQKISFAGVLITLGIIFGDIGTSPLYVLKAIVGEGNVINRDVVLGGLSLVFWTLTLQTTIKYVIITLRADNKGEGGIFSLYALVRRKKKWLLVPAIIGGCTLLADGIITPPISVSSAIEGLRIINPEIQTIPIIILIIIGLFVVQQYGTNVVGKSFGPIMVTWFTMLGTLGFFQVIQHPEVLQAINPYYGIKLLVLYPQGFWLLGAVFLCTTGAEALYSDLGHCGRQNIQVSWTFVKTSLLLNYYGQGAWLILNEGKALSENPFYAIMPDWFVVIGIVIATLAAIIASQAVISGAYTLISEAMRLDIWPKVRVNYPTEKRGQLYVPSINWLLMLGCVGVVLLFKESSAMEAAYGLTINVTMLMTTILLNYYLKRLNLNRFLRYAITTLFVCVEIGFLVANLEKFAHGGWFTFALGSFLFVIMWAWHNAKKIKNKYLKYTPIKEHTDILNDISNDETIPKYASQLVFLTSSSFNHEIENKMIYSITEKQPKRADIYWFVHVDVCDDPYRNDYKVTYCSEHKNVIRVDFKLGFKVEQRISQLFRVVVEELVRNGEISIQSKYKSLAKYHKRGDFRFIVIEKVLTKSFALPIYSRLIMGIYFILKKFSVSEEKAFGLDLSMVVVEKVPLILEFNPSISLNRVYE
jgi:KUP system potassium uptake protein